MICRASLALVLRARLPFFAGLVAGFLGASPARASVADLFDLGPAMGQAGALGARADSGAAAYYNPAGLAFAAGQQVRLGVQSAASFLRRDSTEQPLADPWGLLVEASGKLPLAEPLGDRLAVGALLYIPPGLIVGVDSPATTDVHFAYYDNRHQRIVVMPALALRLTQAVALGVGINYFASLEGGVRVEDVPDNKVRVAVEQKVLHRAAPHLGLRVGDETLAVGVTYRGAFSVPVTSDNFNGAGGAPAHLFITGEAMFTPPTWVLAATFPVGPLAVELDVSARLWSAMRRPFAQLVTEVRLPTSTIDLAGATTKPPFAARDVVRTALAVTCALPLDLDLAAGWAFEPSPFVADGGVTNILDGDKHLLGLGLSWTAYDNAPYRVALELAGQLHLVASRTLYKSAAMLPDDELAPGWQTRNPGYPKVSGGGAVLAGSLSIVISRTSASPELAPHTRSLGGAGKSTSLGDGSAAGSMPSPVASDAPSDAPAAVPSAQRSTPGGT